MSPATIAFKLAMLSKNIPEKEFNMLLELLKHITKLTPEELEQLNGFVE